MWLLISQVEREKKMGQNSHFVSDQREGGDVGVLVFDLQSEKAFNIQQQSYYY
jgi:hypothetical protein